MWTDKINKVWQGDCLDVLKTLPDNTLDSLVTDPPAGISFMGKEWDDDKGGRDGWVQWLSSVMLEAVRVMKPGAHGLVWALPRTSHWTALALEDAGFEIRDCVYYIFGSGFPKSLDISKAIDKQAGAERKVIGQKLYNPGWSDKSTINDDGWMGSEDKGKNITEPFTQGSKQWEGYGTALKPAVECWWLVRKPISEKTIAENILKWGVGGLNIDGSRVNNSDMKPRTNDFRGKAKLQFAGAKNGLKQMEVYNSSGRFPAHLIHDGSEEVVGMFPNTKSGKAIRHNSGGKTFGGGKEKPPMDDIGYADSGSAARFFYCAKPSKAERDMGLEGMEEKQMGKNQSSLDGGKMLTGSGNERSNAQKNHHPTVKAQALMQYLIKLITPPKGIVLDPFAGSGSTLIAAQTLGHTFIGIEKELEYVEISKARLKIKQPKLL